MIIDQLLFGPRYELVPMTPSEVAAAKSDSFTQAPANLATRSLPPEVRAFGEVVESKGVADSAQAVARATIRVLRGEISQIENRHVYALRRSNTIVESIEKREKKIKANREEKADIATVCAAFGFKPGATLGFGYVLADDKRLQALNTELKEAKGIQTRARSDLGKYKLVKEAIEERVDQLTQSEAGLLDEVEEISDSHAPLHQARARLDRGQKLLKNLKEQVALLTALRDAAIRVSAPLEKLLAQLESLALQAEAWVDASQADLHNLIDIVSADDPHDAAQAWLDDKVSAQNKQILRRLNLRVESYVDHLLTQLPANSEARYLLRERLLAALKGASAA